MDNVIIVVSIAIVAVIHLPSEDVSTTFTHIKVHVFTEYDNCNITQALIEYKYNMY